MDGVQLLTNSTLFCCVQILFLMKNKDENSGKERGLYGCEVLFRISNQELKEGCRDPAERLKVSQHVSLINSSSLELHECPV